MRSALVALCLFTTTAHAVPAQFTHQGRLLDSSGVPLEGEATITFRVTVAETGGDVLWEEPITVSLTNGFYSAVLGADEDGNPLDSEAFIEAPVWLELQLDGEPAMFPRSPINAVPYATMATVAEEVAGGPVDASQVSIAGTPVINEAGEWVGPAATVSWDDIEGVPDDEDSDSFADLGASCLDGNIPTWDGTLMAWGCGTDADTQLSEAQVDAMVADNGYAMAADAFGGSFTDLTDVPSGLDDGDDNTQLTEAEVDAYVSDNGYAMGSEVFTGSFLDLDDVPVGLEDGDDDSFADLGASCTDGAIPVWDAELELWACGSDTDTDTDTLAELACTDGQIAAWDDASSSWICSDGASSESGSTWADMTIGASNGGTSSTSGDTPISVPDDNPVGISSTQYVAADEEVVTVTVDVEVTHADMSQVSIKLFSPAGTEVTLYSGGEAGEANLNTNFGWQAPIDGGNVYSFNGESSTGTWRLQVIDTGTGETGTLDSWTLRVNEEWDGELFVGKRVTVPGTLEVRDELRVARGAELVFTNINGEETARLNGEGMVPQGGIIMWSGSDVPDGWALCDGTDGTPNLSDRFIVAAGSSYAVGTTGDGSVTVSTSNKEVRARYHLCCGYNTEALSSVSVSNPVPKYYALAFIMRK